jgi:16S rRNA (cytosine967-C5)-methyltransferase
MRQRKYIGAKDRRFICQTVWEIIRRRLRLEFEAKSNDARQILLCFLKDEDFDLITGGQYGLKELSAQEKKWLKELRQDVYPLHVALECPKWLFDEIDNAALIESLNKTASADIRANFISAQDLKRRLNSEGLFFCKTPYSPFGLRSEERVNLNNCIAYKEGLFEVQDESCQVGALLCNARAGEKIVDYCAGAGGKSLALGAMMQNEGVVFCHDIDFERMNAICGRAQRLGIHNLKLINKVEDDDFDLFVCDAPCSGSGTFRRAPDAKFRLKKEMIDKLNKVQSEILETAYEHTKKGGRIVYMTCSVLKKENEDIVEKFIERHKDVCFCDHKKLWGEKIDAPYVFLSSRYLHFSPLVTNTDGFFFCMMQKS